MDNETIMIILAALLALSEALSYMPKLQSNGILQMIISALRALCAITKKKED